MKKLNFETSKGKFVVVDIESDKDIYDIQSNFGYLLKDFCDWIYLKDITEQQASEIVDYEVENVEIQGGGFYNTIYNYEKGDFQLGNSQIDSLYSLITSNGYYLFENPIQYIPDKITNSHTNLDSQDLIMKYYDAKDKTFFNPIIFKLV